MVGEQALIRYPDAEDLENLQTNLQNSVDYWLTRSRKPDIRYRTVTAEGWRSEQGYTKWSIYYRNDRHPQQDEESVAAIQNKEASQRRVELRQPVPKQKSSPQELSASKRRLRPMRTQVQTPTRTAATDG